jgi:hypothetical protein
MSSDLREQIREVVVLIEDSQAPILGAEVRAGTVGLASTSKEASPPLRRLVIVAFAFAAVLILVGGVAWLSRSTVGTPADESVPPPTIAQVTTITEAEITTDTVVAPTTTIVAAPIVPPGDGPKLSFVQAEDALDVQLSEGVWFNGALYALGPDRDSGGRTLHRSTDGLRWEVVSGLPASDGYIWHSMLETDGNRLVNVVTPEEGTSIEVFTSLDGDDWSSTIVQPPIPLGPNMAGEFRVVNGSNTSSTVLSVGPKGIVLAATVTLSFEGESFANGLVDADEGIHVEVVDLDVDRGVMIVRFLDESNDMTQIGELEEVDLNSAGFSGAFSNLLDAMAADPDWNPQIERFVAQLTSEATTGSASASVGYAWHSPDGITWQRIDTAGPGEDSEIWTLTDPPNRLFEDIPTDGMHIEIGNLGLIGTPWHDYTRGPGVTEEVELLLSVDGTSWTRWEPSECGKNPGWANVSIVGMSDDFVVIQMSTWEATTENGCCENSSHSLWIGTIP